MLRVPTFEAWQIYLRPSDLKLWWEILLWSEILKVVASLARDEPLLQRKMRLNEIQFPSMWLMMGQLIIGRGDTCPCFSSPPISPSSPLRIEAVTNIQPEKYWDWQGYHCNSSRSRSVSVFEKNNMKDSFQPLSAAVLALFPDLIILSENLWLCLKEWKCLTWPTCQKNDERGIQNHVRQRASIVYSCKIHVNVV